jgi:hypothetical protein
MNEIEAITHHYEVSWKGKSHTTKWRLGPNWQMPAEFSILVFPPSTTRKMWTYATCGMSQQGDAPPLEIHLLSPIETEAHVELLPAVSHYHLTGAYLDVGHIVNFGRPWLSNSTCDHGLISLPYLDGPTLEWLDFNERRIRFLWLIPLTVAEVEFKQSKNLESLEQKLEEGRFDYLDPLRKSVA